MRTKVGTVALALACLLLGILVGVLATHLVAFWRLEGEREKRTYWEGGFEDQ